MKNFFKKVHKKIQSNKGVSLMEMLVTIVLILIMSGLITTGMSLAVNTMADTVAASESQILCSTLATRVYDIMCNELSTAEFSSEFSDAEESNNVAAFYTQTLGSDKKTYTQSTDGGEVFLRYHTKDIKLLPANTYPEGVKATISVDDSADDRYTVHIEIHTRKGATISHSTFEVPKENSSTG